MRRKRKQYSPEFKAKVALAAIKKALSIRELRPNQVKLSKSAKSA